MEQIKDSSTRKYRDGVSVRVVVYGTVMNGAPLPAEGAEHCGLAVEAAAAAPAAGRAHVRAAHRRLCLRCHGSGTMAVCLLGLCSGANMLLQKSEHMADPPAQ